MGLCHCSDLKRNVIFELESVCARLKRGAVCVHGATNNMFDSTDWIDCSNPLQCIQLYYYILL